jgi:lysophospholipase L1-like esterase
MQDRSNLPTDGSLPGLPLRRNRFARYPKTTLCVVVVTILALIELSCYLIIVVKGHRELRFQYPYNRILSGYTVFQNVPGHSFRTSAIKTDPGEPDPVLDEHGFLHDAPVMRDKPPGTFRIFLLGGSTAFGAGQNVRYHAAHPYQDGLYSFPPSIAGQLQKFLQQHDSTTHYEVINAAGFERRIHQSLIQYIETLSQFHPDLIISLEGMNDVYSLITGTPFSDVQQQLPFYVDLYHDQRSWLRYSSTYYVLSTAYSKWVNRQRSSEPSPKTDVAPTAEASSGQPGAPAAAPPSATTLSPRAAYDRSKEHYKQTAARLLQIVRQYFAVLSADHQPSMFVLQPLLNRTQHNKQLSETERKFVRLMVPAATAASGPVDDSGLLLAYFFDDYFSDELRKLAKEFGVEFIDLNAEITSIGPDVEFYTDYCHLTPAGNRGVAEILGRAILAGRWGKEHRAEPKPESKATP